MPPLGDDFSLTKIEIETINAASVKAKLTAHPNDVKGRGIYAMFTRIWEPANMADAVVEFSWKHNDNPSLSGVAPFEDVDSANGVFKIYYPEAMLEPGSVSALIRVYQSDRDFAIPLPTIEVLTCKTPLEVIA